MHTQKPQLFPYKKEFLWFCSFFIIIFFIHISFIYKNYQSFIVKPFYYTYVSVINSYMKEKGKKSYQVLKLKSDEGFVFYTTTYKKTDYSHSRLRLQIFPNEKISFSDYLSVFYVKSRIKKKTLLDTTLKDRLLEEVSSQHNSIILQSFYNAIFFATPIVKELREKISLLGVSHLIALSGFHLGILWGLIYGILAFLYKPLQQKFFPYRHRYLDVGVVVLLFLLYYIYFVGYPASLMRSFVMLFFGWSLLLLGVELVSFKLLTVVGLLLLVVFPSLLFSLSFWFSMFGVFYIFLLLYYSKTLSQWTIMLLIIPFGIFVLMLPIVHAIFPIISNYQLLSPFLSLVFIPFYPLVILLHFIGMGGLFDKILLILFDVSEVSTSHILPLWSTISYILLSFLATKYKVAFIALFSIALNYMVYLFIFIE